MFEQYKQKAQHYSQTVYTYISRLRDIQVAGQALFAIIVLLVTWSGVKAIAANYQLEKQITTLQQQNNLQELENSNLQLQNNYYNSNQYLELSARQNFGLAEPGEKELLVPTNVALSYVVSQRSNKISSPTLKIPAYQRNLSAWVDFFLHRKSTD